MWNIIIISSDSLVAVCLLLLAVASLMKRGYKNPINRLFSTASVLSTFLLITMDISNQAWLPDQFVLYDMHVLFAVSFAAIFMFVKLIARLANDPKFNLLIKNVSWPLWIICAVGATPLVITRAYVSNNTYIPDFGPLIWPYILGIVFMIGLVAYGMIHGLRYAKGLAKRQLISTGLGLLISLIIVILLGLVIPLLTNSFSTVNFSTFPFMILVFSLYYGVVRYHLFDIRLATVRTLTYVLSLSVLVGLYFGLAAIVSKTFKGVSLSINQGPISLVVILVLLLIFQPVKLLFDRLTNSIFYRDYYKSDEFFARFNQILTSTTDMRTLLERASVEISTTVKSEQAFFFINTFNEHYITSGTTRHSQLPKDDALKLQEVYSRKKGVIVAPMLAEDDPVRHLMLKHGIELMMPLFQSDVVGYLCLGLHQTSHYTTRDIKVLRTIADESIVAIHNTLSVEEVKKSNLRLRQMDQAKDEFVSIAGHELRTPMTIIRGSVSLLEREQLGPVNDKQKQILDNMNRNTKALIDLVNDMLDLSKLESDKLQLSFSNTSLNQLVKESIEKIRLLYEEKGVKLTYSGVHVKVKTDPDKFERILLNLLSNAYKFTDAGGSVTITSTINSDDNTAMVCVTDTGVGIPAEAMGILFKRFSQVDNYLHRQSSGTGLGLAICKELIEKLDGRIWAKSQVGEGSSFYFTMPIAIQQEVAGAATAAISSGQTVLNAA